MKLNKKALKVVCKFWAFVFSIIIYSCLIGELCTHWTGWFFVGALFPIMGLFSLAIYEGNK